MQGEVTIDEANRCKWKAAISALWRSRPSKGSAFNTCSRGYLQHNQQTWTTNQARNIIRTERSIKLQSNSAAQKLLYHFGLNEALRPPSKWSVILSCVPEIETQNTLEWITAAFLRKVTSHCYIRVHVYVHIHGKYLTFVTNISTQYLRMAEMPNDITCAKHCKFSWKIRQ